MAAFGAEQLVAQRIEHDAGRQLAMLLERDRDRPVRQAVEEVGGAVERVDDPAVVRRAPGLDAALLHDEPVVGTAALELFLDQALGAAVGGGDEVAGSLDRDLELLDLAEVAGEQAGRARRGANHDLEIGGAGHQGLPSVRMARASAASASSVARNSTPVVAASARAV